MKFLSGLQGGVERAFYSGIRGAIGSGVMDDVVQVLPRSA
jgi:hypothetical protein